MFRTENSKQVVVADLPMVPAAPLGSASTLLFHYVL
jgi:hypothetical protein